MEFSRIYQLQEAASVARDFLGSAGAARVFAFHGLMGAGKTTFIASICHRLGVSSPVSSPTFSLANAYLLPEGRGVVHHLDLYRLQNDREAFDAGLEEILFSGEICFVEWPEKAEGIFPPGTVHVWLEALPDGSRRIRMQIPDDNG